MSKKRPTKDERQYLNRVAELGCIICRSPAEIHHVRSGAGMGQRASHYDTIPLCPDHHRNGGHGIAIHAGLRTWQAIFGTERDLLGKTKRMIEEVYGE